MACYSKIALSAAAFASVASAALAQNAPPTYQADPSVYKVIFEDANFRVIEANWKAGVTDKPHSHPAPSVTYWVTDCTLQVTSSDGKTANVSPKAGAVTPVPITASHTGRNVAPAECKAIFFERK